MNFNLAKFGLFDKLVSLSVLFSAVACGGPAETPENLSNVAANAMQAEEGDRAVGEVRLGDMRPPAGPPPSYSDLYPADPPRVMALAPVRPIRNRAVVGCQRVDITDEVRGAGIVNLTEFSDGSVEIGMVDGSTYQTEDYRSAHATARYAHMNGGGGNFTIFARPNDGGQAWLPVASVHERW